MAVINPADFPGIVQQRQLQPASIFMMSGLKSLRNVPHQIMGKDGGILFKWCTQRFAPLYINGESQAYDIMSNASSGVKMNTTNSF